MGNEIPLTVLRAHAARMAASYRASAAQALAANRVRIFQHQADLAERAEARALEASGALKIAAE